MRPSSTMASKAPVGAGQDAFLGGHQGRELFKRRADGLGQRAFREDAGQQRQGGAGASPLSRLRREIGLLIGKKVMTISSVPALVRRVHVTGMFLDVLGQHACLFRGQGGA